MNDLLAKTQVTINVTTTDVWDALTNPQKIKEYMFGATVVSDWQKGSKIVWKGEMNGKRYEDHGEILDISPNEKLRYTHFSPLSGKPDNPENYHTVTIALHTADGRTKVVLSQNNNENEKAKEEAQKNWKTMLQGLKKVAEAAVSK